MNQGLVIKESSPFTPGKPVPKEYFEGRVKEFNRAVQSIKKTASGNPESLWIIGERGIGKSSFAHLIKTYAEKDANFLTAYVPLGGITELEDMGEKIFSCLVKDNQERSFFSQLKQFFKDHIKQVGIGQLSIELRFSEEDKKSLINNLLGLLKEVLEGLKENDRRAILIVLDDINGLAKNAKFANYLKSLIDENALSQNPLPLSLILCSLSERRQEIISANESVARIFYPITLGRMKDEEVINFYKRIFEFAKHKWEEEALKMMAIFSGGFPMLMQEIGDATYYIDQDYFIQKLDATLGIYKAAEIIGEKYLHPKVYEAIRSEKYHSILNKLKDKNGSVPYEFSKKQIFDLLDSAEKKVLNNFLQKMKSLGVIAQGEKRGNYQFTNLLYPIYIGMRPRKSASLKAFPKF